MIAVIDNTLIAANATKTYAMSLASSSAVRVGTASLEVKKDFTSFGQPVDQTKFKSCDGDFTKQLLSNH